jgi:release factor glutamine methyltransferase
MQSDFLKKAIPLAVEEDVLMQSQQELFPYSVMIAGREYCVLANVFSPKYFPDIEFFSHYLPIKQNSRFLEIGAGIGFTTIEAAYRGATYLVATDINPDAVENTRKNIALHHAKLHALKVKDAITLDVRQGSVFSPLKKGEKFDTVYWNVPFQFAEIEQESTLLQQSISDRGYQFIANYIRNGSRYLTKEGRLFLGFSSSIGCIDKLQAIVATVSHAHLRYHIQKKIVRNNESVSLELIEIVY